MAVHAAENENGGDRVAAIFSPRDESRYSRSVRIVFAIVESCMLLVPS